MLTETEARSRLLAQISPSEPEPVPLAQALGRYLRQVPRAHYAQPFFDHSSMDGYALPGAAAAGDTFLVRGEQAAGLNQGWKLENGHAIRIFTGAPLPEGTAAVVMQEDVKTLPDRQIMISEQVAAGENIRRAGQELCPGQQLMEPGSRLTPAKLALLASQGYEEVLAGRLPVVGILTTGDEVREAGEPLGAGQIYNSNGIMVQTLVAQHLGCLGVRRHVADDLELTQAALAELAAGCDAIIVVGGVSVGDRDYVKPALQNLGATLDFWRVKIKPGKPFLFGRMARGGQDVPVFGLPGNPVSACCTFTLFVLPALRHWQGAAAEEVMNPGFFATAAEDLANDGDRDHYLRGWYYPAQASFLPVGTQQSHALFGLAQSNSLARVPAGTRIARGEQIQGLFL